ncbi:MAG: hypothetical protein AB1679_35740 [Actinomycetota bacterium]|jgi:hypothetical protein
MNPNTVFSASLVASLVLWFPSMQACLRGDLDLTPAALRYLLALTLSRLAMNFLARLINAYRTAQLPEPSGEAAPAAGSSASPSLTAETDATPHRRRTDRMPAEGDGDPGQLAA